MRGSSNEREDYRILGVPPNLGRHRRNHAGNDGPLVRPNSPRPILKRVGLFRALDSRPINPAPPQNPPGIGFRSSHPAGFQPVRSPRSLAWVLPVLAPCPVPRAPLACARPAPSPAGLRPSPAAPVPARTPTRPARSAQPRCPVPPRWCGAALFMSTGY